MTDEPPQTLPLLDRLRAGDRDALAALFAYYRSRLGQMLRLRFDARVAARVDPSDVLQEAYLDAVRQIDGYLASPQVAFYVWLRGLTWKRLLNVHRQHLTAKSRSVERELPLPAESSMMLAKALFAQGPSPSQVLLQEELRRRLQRALGRLTDDDREVLLMRHAEDMTNIEVAQALGLTPSGATMRYGRALVRLKEILTEDSTSSEASL
jgi:RNA polymerase sigma-70 factor (ECF subfamily)